MKSLTIALGVLAALSVAGAMTPSGQAVLGMQPRHESPAIAVISDAPPPAPKPCIGRLPPVPSRGPRPFGRV